MQSSAVPSDVFLPSIFFACIGGLFLATILEIVALYLLKRMQGARPVFFVIVANVIATGIIIVIFVLSIAILTIGGYERLKAGAPNISADYDFASKAIFLLVPFLIFPVRGGLLMLFRFSGSVAAWIYALASSFIIGVIIAIAFAIIQMDMANYVKQ
jgi:hypothetical protein